MAGRKLSKKNESTLRAAMEAITSILAQLEDVDGESDSAEAKEARRVLQEAANLGNWLESRIHLAFTQIADDMFGNGSLTREERIGLSGAIGSALDAFSASVAESLPQVYQRPPWQEPEMDAAMAEAAIESEFVPLVEGAVRRDGTIPIKLIQPGWGSSGHYSKEVLERDGPKIFTKGTQMFWDHPTAQEEAARPEGSLNSLAAELIDDARYADGPAGPGLYANAKVFEGYQQPVNEMAKHIGVSIRASGRATMGKAEGREGLIVQGITSARSVDFVTKPGAGGQIIDMFEAARPQTATVHKEPEVNDQQFQEALAARDTQIARLSERLILSDARDLARQTLAGATIPDVTRNRLIESLSSNPPVKDGALDREAFATQIQEAVTAEVKYLTEAAGYGSGRVEGMGASATVQEHKPEEAQARMVRSFMAMGLTESAAKSAAMGRGY